MQHLSYAYYDIGPEGVLYEKGIDKCLDKHGHRYQDFVAFPVDHGYEIDREYRLVQRIGVGHDPRFASKPGNMQSCNQKNLNKDEFLQAWLFFGIIRCVVREEKQLIEDRKLQEHKERLYTVGLKDAVNTWSKYLRDLARNSRNEAKMRCVEAVQMLTLARRVIIANLSDGNQREIGNDQRELHSLCLMVLGETLSAALVLTMERCNIDIHGWHLDTDGWGPPTYVVEKMEKLGWCLRLQEVLKGQFGRSATLLYASLQFHLSAQRQGPGVHLKVATHHSQLECTKQSCHLVEASFLEATEDEVTRRSFQYRSLHHESCKDRSKCRTLGPDTQRLRDILEGSEPRKGIFPLLRYHEAQEHAGPHVEVQEWSSDDSQKDFATISHVWAHGLGNENKNKIRQCQLKYIQNMVNKILNEQREQSGRPQRSEGSFFWLDTLAIPIGEPKDSTSAELRRKAIGSIYHVFEKAECSIIIDRYLSSRNTADDRLRTAVILLSSGWMKRLWTLQEAFVTKYLFLAMGKSEGHRKLDTLMDKTMSEEDDVIKNSSAASIQSKLFQNLMEAHRQLRKKEPISIGDNDGIQITPEPNLGGGSEEKRRWSMLIADAWRSTRYRDIGRPENETLALASLFDLSIPLEAAERPIHSDKNHALRIKLRDRLMKSFWKSLKNEKNCAIPTGVIFTPGERISLPGFGWAPRTWMVGKDESYPYPLSIPCYSETLVAEGLMVQYPGFIIHARSEEYGNILGTNKTGDKSPGFMFPTSSDLHDWYLVEQLDKVETGATGNFIQELLVKVRDGGLPTLGVILSRPRPTEFPKEVALLVEIYRPETPSNDSRKNDLRDQSRQLYCKIVRRLEISRVSILEKQVIQSAGHAHVREKYKRFDVAIVGETLSDDQYWFVDGRTDRIQRHDDDDEDDDDDQYFSAAESQESQSPTPEAHGTNDEGTGNTWTFFNYSLFPWSKQQPPS